MSTDVANFLASHGTLDGRKDDAGKAPWHLVPWRALGEVVAVLAHGATKYGAWNWTTVPKWRDRYFAACLRHLLAWQRGELVDAESGRHHLAHASACVLFLLHLELFGKGEP